MLRAVALLVLLLCAVPAAGVRAATGQRSPASPEALRAVVAGTGAPGGVMAVDHGVRRWVGRAGVADVGRRTPMRVTTRFRAGDVTQAFLAVALQAAIADGATHLEERASEFLYDFGPDVRVRHLLTHTSGLLPGGRRTAPGRFAYNPENYVLVSRVLEAAAGSAAPVELRSRVFGPLRLAGTAYDGRATVPGLARGYAYGARRKPAPVGVAGDLVRAAGVVSTPADLARFLRALLSGRVLPERQTRELRELAVRVQGFPAERFGLGLFAVRTPCGQAWGHRGRTPGHTTWVFATADGRRAVSAAVNVGGLTLARLLAAEQVVRAALCD